MSHYLLHSSKRYAKVMKTRPDPPYSKMSPSRQKKKIKVAKFFTARRLFSLDKTTKINDWYRFNNTKYDRNPITTSK